jgi:hypothetical protein
VFVGLFFIQTMNGHMNGHIMSSVIDGRDVTMQTSRGEEVVFFCVLHVYVGLLDFGTNYLHVATIIVSLHMKVAAKQQWFRLGVFCS